MALKYSILPCPKGCSLSGSKSAILVEIIVTIDESASLKLFTASNKIAIEFEIKPIIALKVTNNKFIKIPIILVFIITFSLFFLL